MDKPAVGGFFNAKMKEIIHNPSNYSPLNKIQAVVCSSPGIEAVYGLAMPKNISLFEIEASPDSKNTIFSAQTEHIRMQSEFSKRGIEVFNMRQVIGEELARNGSPFKNANHLMGELSNRAHLLHKKYNIGKEEDIIEELEILFNEDRKNFGDDVAIAINSVLTNCVDTRGNYKEFDIMSPPAANFLFWRDTNHITGNQVRTHRMFYPIRQQEVILAEIGLRALGINHENMKIQYGSIEGGDVMPIEINGQRYAFIGRAERTSDGGVERWFQTHEDLWNQDGEGIIPAVIEGPTRNTQNQMHLDTFFQQVGKDSCIHCDKLTSRRRISVLTRRGSEIVKVDTTKFNEWIEKKFTNPYIMTREEQLHYAPNILVDAGSTVYITRNDSPEVTKFIKEQVPEIVLLDLQYLTKLYGGVHCSTSEIRKL